MYLTSGKGQKSPDDNFRERMNKPVPFTKSVPSRARVSDFRRCRNPKEAWTTQNHTGAAFQRNDCFKKTIDIESQFQTELSKCLFEKALEKIDSKNSEDDIALLQRRHLSTSRSKSRPSSSLSYWSSQPAFELNQSLWTIKTNCLDPRTSLNIKQTNWKSPIIRNNEKFDTYFVNGKLDVQAVAKSHGPIDPSTGGIRTHVHRIKSGSTHNLKGLSLMRMYSDKIKENEYRQLMKLYMDKPPPAPPPPLTPEEKQKAHEEALRILTEKLKAEEEARAAKEAELKREAEERAAAEAAAAAASRPSSSGKTVTFNEKLTSTKVIGGRKKSRKASPARRASPTRGKMSSTPSKSFPGSGRISPSNSRKNTSKLSPSTSPKPHSPKGKKKKGSSKKTKGRSKKKQAETVVTPPLVEPIITVTTPDPEELPSPVEPTESENTSEPGVILLDDPPNCIPTTEYKTKNERVFDWLYSCSSAASGQYQPLL